MAVQWSLTIVSTGWSSLLKRTNCDSNELWCGCWLLLTGSCQQSLDCCMACQVGSGVMTAWIVGLLYVLNNKWNIAGFEGTVQHSMSKDKKELNRNCHIRLQKFYKSTFPFPVKSHVQNELCKKIMPHWSLSSLSSSQLWIHACTWSRFKFDHPGSHKVCVLFISAG
jgi:hypothetical protein